MEAAHNSAVALVAVVNVFEVVQVLLNTQHVSIVLEDMVVTSHRSWADALVVLFTLMCALHLKYLEKLRDFSHVFFLIQMVPNAVFSHPSPTPPLHRAFHHAVHYYLSFVYSSLV